MDRPARVPRRWGAPSMLAIPGNHDWYDGLTGFMRVFGQQAWIGGRQTVQTRSYFAAALPGRWWLWGIDIQSDAYLDSAQIRYFQRRRRRDARRRSADPVHGEAELGRRPRTRRVPQPRLRRTQSRARSLRGRADDLGRLAPLRPLPLRHRTREDHGRWWRCVLVGDARHWSARSRCRRRRTASSRGTS